MNLRTLSISQAVAATGIPRVTLYRLCESGQLQANRPSPRGRWRISEQSLQDWIQHSAPATPRAEPRDDDKAFRERFPEVSDERVFG